MPIVQSNPSGKLQELLSTAEDELFAWIKHEHETRFPPDSKIKDDPLVISCNVYNLTMHFCVHLMQAVMKRCVDMQAEYIDKYGS